MPVNDPEQEPQETGLILPFQETKPTPSAKPTPLLPDPVTTRTRLLERAGCTEAVQAELVREALTVLREALSATKQQVITYRGEVTDIIVTPDWGTRSKASERIAEIVGIKATPQATAQPTVVVQEAESIRLVFQVGGQAIEMDAPTKPYNGQGDVIDVTPEQPTGSTENLS
jgi:hypothetical protein